MIWWHHHCKKCMCVSSYFFKHSAFYDATTISAGSNPVIGFWSLGFLEGFGWVHSLVLVDEPGFEKAQSSVFPDLGLGLACFWLNRFKLQDFWRGSNGFKVQFWWTNLGSSEFEIWPIKFEAAGSALYLGWMI